MNKYLILIGLSIILTRCIPDAERDNPLDVNNSRSGLLLEGRVFSYYPPHQVLINANITLQPGNQIAFSDQKGSFVFENLKPNEYTICCNAEGFASDTIQIEINADKALDFYLDGLPQITSTRITTTHISRWFPVEDVYYLKLMVEADDLDGIGDILSVQYEIPALNYLDTLFAETKLGVYSGQRFENELPGNSLHTLIGKSFVFYVKDKPGTRVATDDKFITRIIEKIPVLVAPVQMQTVSTSLINFQWEEVYLPYPFTYKIEIYRINPNLFTKVDEVIGIPSTNNSLSFDHTLPAADYYWVLYIIDEIENSSRSKEGSFSIQ